MTIPAMTPTIPAAMIGPVLSCSFTMTVPLLCAGAGREAVDDVRPAAAARSAFL